MSNDTAKLRLKAEIDSARKRVEQLEAVLAAMENPEVVDAVARAFEQSVSGTATGHQGGAGANYDRIAAFFRRTGNKWATAQDVAIANGIKMLSARDVMGSKHKDKFEWRQESPNAAKEFRLRTE